MNKSIKTKKQVSKTLIKLLNYKPLDLITIKELTEKANIMSKRRRSSVFGETYRKHYRFMGNRSFVWCI